MSLPLGGTAGLRYGGIILKKPDSNKDLFPFPQEPLGYSPTEVDFRLRHAARTATHTLGNSDVRSFFESPWSYAFLR